MAVEVTAPAEFQLLRKSYRHELHLADYWHPLQENRIPLASQLEDQLPSLPESVLAVVGLPHGLGVVWTEKGGEATPRP